MSELPSLVDMRRELHADAELSLVEHKTATRIEDWLRGLGLTPRRIVKTGVLATLKGAKRGRTILARADMDALPILEDTGLPYASRNPGAMHACGHDCHMASLVHASSALAARPPERGTVKLLFQPGEEGAWGMGKCIEAGVLRRPKVDAAVGVHVWQWERVGRIGLVRGPCMAAVDEIEITVTGKGGHAADPHNTVDPIVVAAHIITALQTVVSRSISPRDTAVVTIGSVQAGTAFNVIPSDARLLGTIRTFDPKVRHVVVRRVKRIVTDVARAFGANATLRHEFSLPATVNDSDMVDLAWTVAEGIVGKRNVIAAEPSMASEDMSLALAEVPGVFAFVGANGGTRRTSYPHHHAKFDVDEGCLPIAAAFMEGVVRSYLEEAS